MIREINSVRQLGWRQFGIMAAICGACMAYVVFSNASQDLKIDRNISSNVLIEYKTSNNREHDQLNKKVDRVDDKMDMIQSDVSEMKGMLIELTK